MEADAEALKEKVGELTTELEVVKGAQASINATQPASSHTPSSNAAQSRNAWTAGTPYEERTIARIGNVGWNSPGPVITQRATEVLQADRVFLCAGACQ